MVFHTGHFVCMLFLEKNTRQFDESGTVGTERCKYKHSFYCMQIFYVKKFIISKHLLSTLSMP